MLIFLTKSHSYVIFLCVKCSLQNNLATAQQTLLGSLYHFIMSLLIFGFNKMEFNLIAAGSAEIISFSAVVSKVNKMFQSFGFYQREYNLEQLNSTKLLSKECFHLHWRRVLWHYQRYH
jgi:hypothetical protein